MASTNTQSSMNHLSSVWADRIVLLWAVLVTALVFALMHQHTFDDPFITYRYAANLAAGHGFVYNPGLRVLSTTAPLYALALSPFAALGLPLPIVSNLLGSLGLGAGAVALWHMGRAAETPVAGAFAALLFPLTPLLLSTLGAETVPFIALTLWGLWFTWQGRPGWAGVLLAAATLTRADAALAIIIAVIVMALRNGLPAALRMSVICLLCLTPFIVAAWWYFGSPLPATLGAKRSQANIEGSRLFLEGLWIYLVTLSRNPSFWPLLGLAPLGLVGAVTHRGPLSLVVCWSLSHIVAYSLLGVTAYFWYFGPALTGLVVVAGLGAQLLNDGLSRLTQPRFSALGLGLLATMMLFGHLQVLLRLAEGTDQRAAVYRPVGLWLAANTPPDAQVAMLEIGMIGFYAERPVVDFAGLIQPDVAAIFRNGGDYTSAARYALNRYRPEYLVNQEQTFALVSADPAIAAACTEVATIPDPRFPLSLQIFRCHWE